MRQRFLAFALIPATLVLIGAGCQSLYPPTPDTNPGTKNEQPAAAAAATTTTAAPAAGSDEFNFTATALNPGIVKFTWDAPNGFDTKTETYLLLYSNKVDPVYPGAFWYRRSGVDREALWGNLPAGKLNFRMCESKDGVCARYSKNIELDVK